MHNALEMSHKWLPAAHPFMLNAERCQLTVTNARNAGVAHFLGPAGRPGHCSADIHHSGPHFWWVTRMLHVQLDVLDTCNSSSVFSRI